MALVPRLTFASAVLAAGVSCTPEYDITGEPVNVDPGQVTECGFTPVTGTKISEYDCNPVFSGTDEEWGYNVGGVGFHVTEVLGHPFYQMWYTGTPQNASGYGNIKVGYAVSGDGTNWSSHDANPLLGTEPGQWDQDVMQGQVVVWDPSFKQYVMMWGGFTVAAGNSGVGVATSPDGVEWTKNPANPVITSDDAMASNLSMCWPLTMNRTSGGFTAYIAAIDAIDMMLGADSCNIYTMSSIDLVNWTINPSPIMSEPFDIFGPPPTGPDSKGVTSAAVVEYEGTLYMFYTGFTEWTVSGSVRSATNITVNLATSFDGGFTWVKDPGNPLPINLTSQGQVSSIAAQVVGSRIHLWVGDEYADLDAQAIGYFYYEPDIADH